MCGVIVVMEAAVGQLILDMVPIYMIIALDIIIIIWSFVNCPTVICSPTVCYFSWEKPLVKPTATGSSFSYICFAIYFIFTFYSDLLNQNTKILCCTLFYLRSIYSTITTFSRQHAISGAVTRKGLTTPLTRWRGVVICVQGLFTLCCLVLLLVR